jgi:hypothetical protein
MTREGQINEHLERALVETLVAIAEFDRLRVKARANGVANRHDSLAGMLAMLRAALESAILLTYADAASGHSGGRPNSEISCPEVGC